MLIERFLENKTEQIKQLAYPIYDLIINSHPGISTSWKWGTLVFMFGKKILAYFSIKKGMLHLGFWHKNALSSPLIHRDLKLVGYYLIDEITEEILADITISVEEIIKFHYPNKN